MTQQHSVADTLNLAADLIEGRGWIQADGWPETAKSTEPLCLEGGILAALGASMETAEWAKGLNACPSYVAVQNYLNQHDFDLWYWNDAEERTANEVVEVLRATALIESARERETVEVSA